MSIELVLNQIPLLYFNVLVNAIMCDEVSILFYCAGLRYAMLEVSQLHNAISVMR